VAGAGPAGSTASRILAGKGLSVLLVEKSGPPRDKVCGGLLSKACMDLMVGVFGSGPPRQSIQDPGRLGVFVVPPSGMDNGFKVPGEELLNIRRRELDAWLAESAERCGAELLRDCEAVAFRECGRMVNVLLNTKDGAATVTARFLVGADGIYSKTRETISRRSVGQRVIYAQEYHRRSGDIEDCFYMVYRGDISPTYSYLIPKGDRLCLGVGILSARPPRMREGMDRLATWVSREWRLRVSSPVHLEGYSAPFGNISFGRGGVFLVGDAAGLGNPLTGEGIGYAIGSAEAASRAILGGADDPVSAYAAEMKRLGDELESLVRGTLTMDDNERERRVAARKQRSLT
jgi:geranylgeranyl reductase family protein